MEGIEYQIPQTRIDSIKDEKNRENIVKNCQTQKDTDIHGTTLFLFTLEELKQIVLFKYIKLLEKKNI